jgi:hypothetical protein
MLVRACQKSKTNGGSEIRTAGQPICDPVNGPGNQPNAPTKAQYEAGRITPEMIRVVQTYTQDMFFCEKIGEAASGIQTECEISNREGLVLKIFMDLVKKNPRLSY